jgi:SAM-dependent methyltransferase
MEQNRSSPKLYSDFALWWPILSIPEDYAEEAAFYKDLIETYSPREVVNILELGSGGGNNASHLKTFYRLTLVDKSPSMLDVSRDLNPECEHILGDMRSIRLGKKFDAVFIHDAVVYMTDEADLRLAIRTAFEHCKPRGVCLFAPDCTRDSFKPSNGHGGHDIGNRSMRYLEWTWDPDPSDSTYVIDFDYLFRKEDNTIQCEYDRHICGLFTREEWLRFITDTGFEAFAVPFVHSDVEPGSSEVFLGARPAG